MTGWYTYTTMSIATPGAAIPGMSVIRGPPGIPGPAGTPAEELSELNFPTVTEMRANLARRKLHLLLSLVKTRMEVRSETSTDSFIILSNAELAAFSPTLLGQLRQMLKVKEYQLVEREDANGQELGLKICWGPL